MKNSRIILIDISDNSPTFACSGLTLQKPDHFFKCSRTVSNDDYIIKFQNKLMNSDWSSLHTLDIFDEMYDSFFEKLFRIYDECFPMVARFRTKIPC